MYENKEPAAFNQQKARGKKATKIVVIVAAIVIVCFAAYFGITKVIIPNRNYNAAVALMNQGKIVEAYESLVAMNGYKDSAEKAESLYDKYKLLTSNVGDFISFGSYEQDNDNSNGKEPIEWQVLAKDGDKVLVISKYALDTQQYNTELEEVTWETCTLRTWLSETFLNEAFSEAEQSMIQTTEVSADKNPDYSTDPGNASKDKIFLLSINEAEKYFTSDEARMCVPTAYAIANGAHISDRSNVDGAATCRWWLRSPGKYQSMPARVYDDGGLTSTLIGISLYGDGGAGTNSDCVRPAMWIDLEGEFNDIKITEMTEAAQYYGDSIDGNILGDYVAADVGDIIEFGAYEQDNDNSNGKEPIEWQVLAKDGDKVLAISKYALDTQQYNTELEEVTWETCTLRTWLNETFLNEAFSEAEQSMIQTTEVSADKNPDYSTDPGNATKDKIFLLSINEAEKYFASDEARKCVPTAYAIANGAYISDRSNVDGAATCWWWLRSPGKYQSMPARVYDDGGLTSTLIGISLYGDGGAGTNSDGVRPAMWISLDS